MVIRLADDPEWGIPLAWGNKKEEEQQLHALRRLLATHCLVQRFETQKFIAMVTELEGDCQMAGSSDWLTSVHTP